MLTCYAHVEIQVVAIFDLGREVDRRRLARRISGCPDKIESTSLVRRHHNYKTHEGGSDRMAKLIMTRLTGPSPEYLMAFDTRFTSTCPSLKGSVMTLGTGSNDLSPTSRTSSIPFALASKANGVTTSLARVRILVDCCTSQRLAFEITRRRLRSLRM